FDSNALYSFVGRALDGYRGPALLEAAKSSESDDEHGKTTDLVVFSDTKALQAWLVDQTHQTEPINTSVGFVTSNGEHWYHEDATKTDAEAAAYLYCANLLYSFTPPKSTQTSSTPGS